MGRARTWSLVLIPMLVGLTACQEPGQPGPMERAGAHIDHTVTNVQRSVGDFSLRVGQGVDRAGRSVGAAAQAVGTGLHDRLVPPDYGYPPPPPEPMYGYPPPPPEPMYGPPGGSP
jgi:hypothetical protein